MYTASPDTYCYSCLLSTYYLIQKYSLSHELHKAEVIYPALGQFFDQINVAGHCSVLVRLQKVLRSATLTFRGHPEELFWDPAV